MRTLCAVALFTVGAGGLVGAEPKTYESKEGKFSAKFPTTPSVQAKTAGGLTLNMFGSDYEKARGGYLVTYTDLPEAVLKAPQPEQVLASSEKGFVDTFKAKVTKSSATTFGPKKYPARQISGERDEWHIRTTLVLVGNRLYQVCVFGPKDFMTSKEADDFLASFTLTQ